MLHHKIRVLRDPLYLLYVFDVANFVAKRNPCRADMASIRKKYDSGYWFACFTLPDGRRVQRSTKTRIRKEAQKKADEFERASKTRASARQAQKIIADIFRTAHEAELPDTTPRAYVSSWLQRRKSEMAEASVSAFNGASKRFLDYLGEGADRPLTDLEVRHFIQFRDSEAQRIAVATVNKEIKLLRAIFEDARRENCLAENPAKDCARLKESVKAKGDSRRPFTVDELRRVLAVANAEWRSLLLFGLYTGQRLGDLTALTWANIDTAGNEIHLTTRKTGRTVRIPICEPLAEHIASLSAGDDPKAYLHPSAAAASGPTNSNRFTALLADAGLTPPRTHQKKTQGPGRDSRRAPSELSFHSLRHTATSLLKNAGVSPAIVQDIIGHDSTAVSSQYTHIESEAKRKALNSMPDLGAFREQNPS